MGIYKSKNGTYRVEIYKVGRRIASKRGFKTKTEAHNWEDEMIKTYLSEPEKLAKKVAYRFDEVLEKYVNLHLPAIRKTTAIRYNTDINYRIRPAFKHFPITAISRQMVLDFRIKIAESIKPKSVNNCIALLSSIFNFAVDLGMTTVNPCKIDPLKVPARDYSWWSDWNDVTRFLTAVEHDRYAAVFWIALETGMRLGEIVGLSKQDIDFEDCKIRVHQQYVVRKTAQGLTATKTNNIRTIPFDPDSKLVKIMKRAVEASDDSEMIFVAPCGKRVYSTNVAGRIFQGYVTDLGLPRIAFHDLRHTFASWYMKRGGKLWELQRILGHSSSKMTEKYAHHGESIDPVPSIWREFGKNAKDDITPFSRHLEEKNVISIRNYKAKEHGEGGIRTPGPLRDT